MKIVYIEKSVHINKIICFLWDVERKRARISEHSSLFFFSFYFKHNDFFVWIKIYLAYI